MSTHTPGPWLLQNANEYTTIEGKHVQWGGFNVSAGSGDVNDEHYYRIATVSNVNDASHNMANAQLIAAAPDLFAALLDLVGWMPGPAAWHTDAPIQSVERARAALAKATGATP